MLKGQKNIATDRTGEINYNNQGLKMWIIEYRDSHDIDVEFEDGYVLYNKRYYHFKIGKIVHKSYTQLLDRTGEININKFGNKMTIVKYKDNKNVTVQFENGHIKNTSYINFTKGAVSNPYDKILYNIGFIGEGKYLSSVNGNHTKEYEVWTSMLQRCYDEKHEEQNPTYKDCTVDEKWHNFQVFAEWWNENYYEIDDEQMHLDKDILVKGNKRYSHDTCVFVPRNINLLFVKNDANRGDYPIGVYLQKSSGKFVAQYRTTFGKAIRIGSYDTPVQAFNTYKKYKENHIKKMADYYKDKIPQNLYNALYRYIVEITD